MSEKPIDEYSCRAITILKDELFELYQGLGEFSDSLFLVGGLACDLLVKNKLPYLSEYLGTLDIDLAVRFVGSVSSAPESLYRMLRGLEFERNMLSDGSDLMNHSFIKSDGQTRIELDLIADARIPPVKDKLVEISPRVDAAKFKGVYLVFEDYLVRVIRKADRQIGIKIPNIVPFITLKAFAYADEQRHDPKDAYDLWYSVANYGEGPESVIKELLRYRGNEDVKEARRIIKGIFAAETSSGTSDVCRILTRRYNLGRARALNEVLMLFRRL
ncbi:MAG: nucleotidyl transferase AbiEii/AbiGii toxin family protein [Candidatus Omnitrophota bacterium]